MDATTAIKHKTPGENHVPGYAGVRNASDFDSLAQAFASALRDAGSRFEADATALTARADTTVANQVHAKADTDNYAAERKQAETMARSRSKFDDARPDRDSDDDFGAKAVTHADGRDRDTATDATESAPREAVAEAAPAQTHDDRGAASNRGRDKGDGVAKDAGEVAAKPATSDAGTTGGDVADAMAAAVVAPVATPTQHSEQAATTIVSTTPVANAAVRAANGPTEGSAANGSNANAASTAGNADAVKPVATGGDSSNANLMLHGGRQQNGGAANADANADFGLKVADAARSMKDDQESTLARIVGAGSRLSVQTSVTNESSTLVSQPSSNLTSNVVLANEIARSNAPTQPGQHGDSAAITPNPAQMAAGAVVAPSAQQTNAAAQVQAAVADGKAAIQAPAATQGTTHFQPTSGEAAAGTGTQASNQTSNAQQTAQTQHAQAKAEVPQRAFVDQVSVQITKALNNGLDRITVQMRPEHMGRVEVRMELGQDGRVQASVTADNRDTLDLLQRDSRSLEKALQDAGLNADSGSLSFNLRGEGGNGRDAQPTFARPAGAEADTAAEAPVAPPVASNGMLPNGRLDIRA